MSLPREMSCPSSKKALVKICVEIESIGDKIDKDNKGLDEILKGINEISFVASNNVYLLALVKQLCIIPNIILKTRGVEPRKLETKNSPSLKRK